MGKEKGQPPFLQKPLTDFNMPPMMANAHAIATNVVPERKG